MPPVSRIGQQIRHEMRLAKKRRKRKQKAKTIKKEPLPPAKSFHGIEGYSIEAADKRIDDYWNSKYEK